MTCKSSSVIVVVISMASVHLILLRMIVLMRLVVVVVSLVIAGVAKASSTIYFSLLRCQNLQVLKGIAQDGLHLVHGVHLLIILRHI